LIDFSNLNELDKIYLAGFLDGNGSILTQIIKNNSKNSKFSFKIVIGIHFYQLKKRHWFLLWLKEITNNSGYLRIRTDNICEYSIINLKIIKNLLIALYPYLKIKKPTAKLVLEIIELKEKVKTEADFLEVCKLIDKIAEHTDSTKRKVTSTVVEKYFKDHLY